MPAPPPPCSASTARTARIAELIADAHGDLFGTPALGGANGAGTVFEISGSGFSTHKTPSCMVVESHDHFVFAPNLGENPTVNSNVHDEIIDPKSVFHRLCGVYGSGSRKRGVSDSP
jgi:hypothetical protein